MLSRAQIKYIRSLTQQKYRKEHQVFTAEGDKIALEWLSSPATVRMIVGLEGWIETAKDLIIGHPEAKVFTVDEAMLAAVSSLQAPNQVLLVVSMPELPVALPHSGWVLGLESIQDPGNMGTLIRIADWFGIADIICSPGCVDVYNAKVVQAAMGGHLRIRFHETELLPFVQTTRLPVLAATLNGKDISEVDPLAQALLLIGNESKGLSPALIDTASQNVTIPRLGGAESLNAAVSAGIICSHLIAR